MSNKSIASRKKNGGSRIPEKNGRLWIRRLAEPETDLGILGKVGGYLLNRERIRGQVMGSRGRCQRNTQRGTEARWFSASDA